VRGHADLRAAVAATLLCAPLTLLPLGPPRLLFALPLTLFLPGYAIVAAIFARHALDRAKLLLLSLGLSLATLALGAVVLNFVPGGIRAGSWALLLALIVLGNCRAAALRRPRPKAAPAASRRGWQPRPREIALLAGGAAAAALAIALAFAPRPAEDAIGYTEMWIQPLTGEKVSGVRIGVGNREQDDADYELRVRVGEGSGQVLREKIVLSPGQTEVVEVPTAAPPPGEATPVTAALFLAGGPESAYRRVSAWIPAKEETG
jgi:uncharacterized membrane protein